MNAGPRFGRGRRSGAADPEPGRRRGDGDLRGPGARATRVPGPVVSKTTSGDLTVRNHGPVSVSKARLPGAE
jgi:hypothetical protein